MNTNHTFFRIRAAAAMFAVAFAASVPAAAQTPLHETKYDWSQLAASITSPARPPLERARDIYRWLGENIAYDTSYSIYDADGTYEARRGVCQGYCELFHRLGEAVGLRSEIIAGKSKDLDGTVSPDGHAWLFVYTAGNSGILVDPTWGAGSVDGSTFRRNPTDVWFQVDPEWMIFSHFPDDARYQLLAEPVGYEAFAAMPRFEPVLSRCGFRADELLYASLAGSAPEIPKVYSSTVGDAVEVMQVPQERTLRIGTNYEFFIQPKNGEKFAIINGDDCEDDWKSGGGDVRAVRYMPCQAGPLRVSVDRGDHYETVAEYNVPAPTPAELESLEKGRPLMSPALVGLPNFNPAEIKRRAINPRWLLDAVKEEGIKELPKIYPQVQCEIRAMPFNGVLKVGVPCFFSITVGEGVDWAIIHNDEWIRDWVVDQKTNCLLFTYTPLEPGTLKLSARKDDGKKSFYTILEYRIED